MADEKKEAQKPAEKTEKPDEQPAQKPQPTKEMPKSQKPVEPQKSAEKPAERPSAPKPMDRTAQRPGERPSQKPGIAAPQRAGIQFSRAWPAEVEEVIGRTGTRGEAIQVRCKLLEGRDQNQVLRRNVKGPVQLGDILMLRETEMEAKPLNSAGRGRKA